MTWLLLAEAAVPEGGLFDLDATLPLMAVQVVLLTFLLNSLFFRPVGKVVEEREGFISTSLADAKQKLEQVQRLEAELTEQLRGARQAAQAAILEAEQEVGFRNPGHTWIYSKVADYREEQACRKCYLCFLRPVNRQCLQVQS